MQRAEGSGKLLAVDGKGGKLLPAEPEPPQARLIEAGVAQRRARRHVLFQRAEHDNRGRGVDHVVGRDEERVEHGLVGEWCVVWRGNRKERKKKMCY